MHFRDDSLAEAQAEQVRAIFEALCRVQDGARANDGPEALLARFAREAGEAGGPGGAGDEEDLPDFAAEPPVAEPPEVPVIPSPGREPGASRDALTAALLRALGDYQRLLVRYSREFDEAHARRGRGEAEAEDATLERLRAAQALLVKYPIAGQAAFNALVREGRRFSGTDEGRVWRQRLAGSPLLARARTLFEGLAGGIASEEGGALPSAYVDAFLRALDRDLEGVLADLGRAGDRP